MWIVLIVLGWIIFGLCVGVFTWNLAKYYAARRDIARIVLNGAKDKFLELVESSPSLLTWLETDIRSMIDAHIDPTWKANAWCCVLKVGHACEARGVEFPIDHATILKELTLWQGGCAAPLDEKPDWPDLESRPPIVLHCQKLHRWGTSFELADEWILADGNIITTMNPAPKDMSRELYEEHVRRLIGDANYRATMYCTDPTSEEAKKLYWYALIELVLVPYSYRQYDIAFRYLADLEPLDPEMTLRLLRIFASAGMLICGERCHEVHDDQLLDAFHSKALSFPSAQLSTNGS